MRVACGLPGSVPIDVPIVLLGSGTFAQSAWQLGSEGSTARADVEGPLLDGRVATVPTTSNNETTVQMSSINNETPWK